MNITFPKVPTGRNFGSLKVGQIFTAGGNIAFIKARHAPRGIGADALSPFAVNLETGLAYDISSCDSVFPCAASTTLMMEVQ